MTGSPNAIAVASSKSTAQERLLEFLDERRRAKSPVDDLESFEQELHVLFAAAEAQAIADELERFDVDLPAVQIEGVRHGQVLRCEQTYMTAAGPTTVMRGLYRATGERTVCPMELRAGIVEGYWTPRAAQQAAWVVAHLVPQEGEELLGRMGGMNPSKSSLDRLPKQLSAHWENDRENIEAALRKIESVPPAAASVAISLDGVMAPMRDGERAEKRARSTEAGKQTRGPAGYQEVGCGTISLFDRNGDRLKTVRFARMPEPGKATLKDMLTKELEAVLAESPELTVVKLADGAKDNWSYLSTGLGIQVVDFFHAAEQLHSALVAAYGEADARGRFEKLRHTLRHAKRGAAKVIRALVHLRDRFPRRKKIADVLGYFRENRHRMNYATVAAQGLPIGSGVVEAACKTLVTQRLKRSGMRWRHEGGQAILTLRGLIQSDRFDDAWLLLRQTYTRHVELPDNVISLDSRRSR
jgi:hypothetical protein